MRSIRAAQALASRSLLLSSRALHGDAASTAAAAAGGGRLGVQPSPPSQASSSSSSRAMPAGIAGAVSFSLTFATMAAAEAKERPPMDLLPQNVVLYQYQACPFCNKVRAFLDYHDIPYKVVEVNPLSKKEIKWSEYKKVPILTVDGEQLQRVRPDDKATNEEEEKWRRWVDEHLVHVLSPNIYRTTSEALESFDYISKHGNFSFTERFAVKYAGAAAMYMVSKKLKKKYNITDARASLYDAANTWMEALDGRDFLGGSKPNLADLAVFGVLRPIRYLTAGKDMVEHTQIGDWYQRMEDAIGEPSRIQE
uniref:Glutaredoxin domain-containing protein n=2 Tax=Oryza TaxID=4527 RepID=A0A0E0P6B0_ORYRU